MTFVSQVGCRTSMTDVSACLFPFVPSIGRWCQESTLPSVFNAPGGKQSGKPRINRRTAPRQRLETVE